jgi:hypothetical protein
MPTSLQRLQLPVLAPALCVAGFSYTTGDQAAALQPRHLTAPQPHASGSGRWEALGSTPPLVAPSVHGQEGCSLQAPLAMTMDHTVQQARKVPALHLPASTQQARPLGTQLHQAAGGVNDHQPKQQECPAMAVQLQGRRKTQNGSLGHMVSTYEHASSRCSPSRRSGWLGDTYSACPQICQNPPPLMPPHGGGKCLPCSRCSALLAGHPQPGMHAQMPADTIPHGTTSCRQGSILLLGLKQSVPSNCLVSLFF